MKLWSWDGWGEADKDVFIALVWVSCVLLIFAISNTVRWWRGRRK
jgi:hypothetical protein